MKKESNLKSKSEYMMTLFGFLGVFMILTIVLTNFTSKGTYSATASCAPLGETACNSKSGCSWSNNLGMCVGSYTVSDPTPTPQPTTSTTTPKPTTNTCTYSSEGHCQTATGKTCIYSGGCWVPQSTPKPTASTSTPKPTTSTSTPQPTTSVSCGAGKGADPSATTGCSACAAGYYSAAGDNTCHPCPSGQTSNAGASSCTKNCREGKASDWCTASGYYIDANCECKFGSSPAPTASVSCGAGKGADPSATTGCSACAAGYYSVDGDNTCHPCPNGQTSSAGSSSCTVAATVTPTPKAGDKCTSNGLNGYYSSDGTCHLCGVNANASGLTCVCKDGYTGDPYKSCSKDGECDTSTARCYRCASDGDTYTYVYKAPNNDCTGGATCSEIDMASCSGLSPENPTAPVSRCEYTSASACRAAYHGFDCYKGEDGCYKKSSSACYACELNGKKYYTYAKEVINGNLDTYACPLADNYLRCDGSTKTNTVYFMVWNMDTKTASTVAVRSCTPDANESCKITDAPSGTWYEKIENNQCVWSVGSVSTMTVNADTTLWTCVGGGNSTPPSGNPPSGNPTPSVTNSCYKCVVSGDIKYIMASSKSGAANATGASSANDCSTVANSYCVIPDTPTEVTNCYACNYNNGKKYTFATSSSNAASKTGGTGCSIVTDNYCTSNPNDNPKTGTVGVIIAWLIGISAIGYSIWYFKRIGSIK